MNVNNVVNIDIAKAVKQFNAQSLSRTASFANRIGNMLGISKNGERDIYDIYGYPKTLSGEQGFTLMFQYASRQGVANRVTYGIAHSCWRDGFTILEDSDDDDSERLQDELQLLKDAEFVQKLERSDILNRIGRFSLLYVGVPDGMEPSDPLGKASPNRLKDLYFQPFAYDSVEPVQFENDITNPRYGLPTLYQLSRSQRRGDDKDYSSIKSFTAHWSRCILMAENRLDSDIEGVSALEPVFNRILDLDKATGGASEAYFRNARRVTGYEVDKDFAAQLLSDPAAKEAFDEGVQKFTNGWQDHTIASGAKMHTLTAPHYSPLDTVKTALWEVSSATGIPIRVLTGEGAGVMAGAEDQIAYNNLIGDRQRIFCAAQVRAVLRLLDKAGMIKFDPLWSVAFPQQQASTEMQQAKIDAEKGTTLQKIMQAASTPAGQSLDVESALQSLNLEDIEVEDIDLGVEPEPVEPGALAQEPPTDGD